MKKVNIETTNHIQFVVFETIIYSIHCIQRMLKVFLLISLPRVNIHSVNTHRVFPTQCVCRQWIASSSMA